MGKKEYNTKLRPRKKFLNLMYHGHIGKFDYTEGGILWKDMPDEVLIEYTNVMSEGSVKEHLIGEIPKPANKLKTVAPSTDK